jgi:hypothetical protein
MRNGRYRIPLPWTEMLLLSVLAVKLYELGYKPWERHFYNSHAGLPTTPGGCCALAWLPRIIGRAAGSPPA